MGETSTLFNTNSTEDRVKRIVVEKLSVNEEDVVDSANFEDDLGADSLDVVELVMAFEDGFTIEIPDEESAGIKTVGDAIEGIKKLLGEK